MNEPAEGLAPEFEGTSRFEIVRRLGAGAMGVVYEALDRERNARVALKTLRTMNSQELLTLKHEFRSLQDVTHPNLVTLGELIEDDDRWFFTMELVEGEDLLCYVRGPDGGRTASDAKTLPHVPVHAVGRTQAHADTAPQAAVEPILGPGFDEQRLRASLLQLAHALNALHAARKVHRDIKPANVLVSREGRVVVLDFGLAFDVQRGGGWEPRLAGTLGYMPPELFTTGKVDQASDWYAAGVLLFEALTGRQPFVAQSRLALLDIQQRDAPPASEFCVDVPLDLDQLCQDLLRSDPTRRPDGGEVLRRLGEVGPRRLAPVTRQPFVGRGVELERLAAARAEVAAGRSTTVLVRGESGVGKSYLVRQFTNGLLAREPEAVVLFGRCYERESVPYKALDGIVDELTRFLGSTPAKELAALLPDDLAALARVFPVLRGLLPAGEAEVATAVAAREPQRVRAEAFAQLRELLGRVATRHPVVLVVDDLHWTDADSVQLLRELLRPPAAPPLLLIATLRNSDVGQVPMAELTAAIPASEPAYDLGLATLSADDAEQLVRRLVEGVDGQGAIDPRMIAREAGGHPMFIHELVQHVAWGKGDQPALPRIDDAIRARIGRLEDASRTMVELIALAGSPLPQQTIATASRLELDDFVQRATHLRIANLVRTRGGKALDPIEPVHDRVREAVVASLSDRRRTELHLRLAEALEDAAAADPEALAVHWRGAGRADHALRHAVRAAEQASTGVAFRRAARLYRMALELGGSSPEQRRLLSTRLGDALANAGDGAASADAYLTVATDAPLDARIDLERKAAEQLLRAGYIDRGIEQARAVLDRVGMAWPSTPGRALASLIYQRGLVRLRGLRFTERALADIPAADLARFDMCWSLTSLGLVDTIRGAEVGARQLREALRLGEPGRLALSLAAEAVYASQMSGPARARKLLAEAGRLAAKVGRPYVDGIVAGDTGLVEYVFGNYALAREHLVRADRHFRASPGAAWEQSAVRLFEMVCLCCEGRLDELARRLPPILAEADDRGDLFAATSIRVATEHLVLIAAGRPEQARANVVAAMARWSQTGFQMQHRYALVTQVEIDLSQGQGRAAHARIEGAWRQIEGSMLLQIRQQRIETLSARGRAAVAAAVDGEDPRRLLAEAERHARTIIGEYLAYAVGQGRLITAAVAHARGQRERAAADLAVAVERFETTGMALHAAVARRRRGELLGGDDGRALIATADAWMKAAGVVDLDAIVRMLAPGFGASARLAPGAG